eukprot:gene30314-35309_t
MPDGPYRFLPENKPILDVMKDTGRYSIFLEALQVTGLAAQLAGASDPDYPGPPGPPVPPESLVVPQFPWWFGFGIDRSKLPPPPPPPPPPPAPPAGIPSMGPYTILAPDDNAFDKLLRALGGGRLLSKEQFFKLPELKEILQMHIAPGRYTTGDLYNNTHIFTAMGVTVTPFNDACMLEGSIALHDSCVDKPTPDSFTCGEQKTFNKCYFPFMTSALAAQWQGGFCQFTCERCSCAPDSGLPCAIIGMRDVVGSNGIMQGISRVLFPPPQFSKEMYLNMTVDPTLAAALESDQPLAVEQGNISDFTSAPDLTETAVLQPKKEKNGAIGVPRVQAMSEKGNPSLSSATVHREGPFLPSPNSLSNNPGSFLPKPNHFSTVQAQFSQAPTTSQPSRPISPSPNHFSTSIQSCFRMRVSPYYYPDTTSVSNPIVKIHYSNEGYDLTMEGLERLSIEVDTTDAIEPAVIASSVAFCLFLAAALLMAFLRSFVEANHDSTGTSGNAGIVYLVFTAIIITTWFLLVLWAVALLIVLPCPGTCLNLAQYPYIADNIRVSCICDQPVLQGALIIFDKTFDKLIPVLISAAILVVAGSDINIKLIPVLISAAILVIAGICLLMNLSSAFSHTKRERE